MGRSLEQVQRPWPAVPVPPTHALQGCTLGRTHYYSDQDFFGLCPAKIDAEATTALLLASHAFRHGPPHIASLTVNCFDASGCRDAK